jgi:hypothetical protein
MSIQGHDDATTSSNVDVSEKNIVLSAVYAEDKCRSPATGGRLKLSVYDVGCSIFKLMFFLLFQPRAPPPPPPPPPHPPTPPPTHRPTHQPIPNNIPDHA